MSGGAPGDDDDAAGQDDTAAPGPMPPTPLPFEVGDWFLGAGDGGAGRLNEKRKPPPRFFVEQMPQVPAKWLKKAGYDPATDGWPEVTPTALDASDEGAESDAETGADNDPGAGSDADFADDQEPTSYIPTPGVPNPSPYASYFPSVPPGDVGYNGELQLMEDHRSPTIAYSDLTDTSRWTCSYGPTKMRPDAGPDFHPQLEFTKPQRIVHVHLEDKADGPAPRVMWDAIYDMGGTEWLKPDAEALGGKRPTMELFCPPYIGPPHWYELTVSREGMPGVHPHMIEEHLGTQILSSYTPDHDPMVKFSTFVAEASCTVM